MSGGKETPRQKMIGMMYLVLTALLAMNVSKQILKGYVTVNESMEHSKKNLTTNNKLVMEAFQNTINGNPAAKPYYDKAVEAEQRIKEVVKYIDGIKKIVFEETEKLGGGDTMQLRFAPSLDNYDIPTHILIGSDAATPENKPNSALELKSKMDGLMNGLIAQLDGMQADKKTKFLPEIYNNLKKKLTDMKPHDSGAEEDGIKMTWDVENFYHLPEAAVITNLNKMQADLLNLEAEILGEYSAASGKLAIKFDKLTAKVIAPSSYIQAGQPYKADVFLAASSSALGDEQIQVSIGKDTLTGAGNDKVKLEMGMGKIELPTGGVGEQNHTGVIMFKKPDGTVEPYPYHLSYMVAAPSAAVALDKMNVFYIGVPNPISVSAGGVAPSELSVSGSGGIKLAPKGGAGKYEVTATTPGSVTISVSAKTKDGMKPQGTFKFRVKKIPDPVAKVGGNQVT